MTNQKQLQDLANLMRRDVLKMTTEAGSGHPTSCMSSAEIMSVLFFNEMSFDTKNAFNPDNDEFILSKGHAAPILYSALFHAGAIKDNLMTLRKLESRLEGHPMPSLKFVKAATGSLGQGLSIGLGISLAGKLQKRKYKTYVLLGDSEVAEGEIYEALQLASFYRLNNLIAIVDVNKFGQRGQTMLGHKVKDYKKRFSSFGWNVVVVDGHNIKKILNAFKSIKNSKKPSIILAKTFKGKGVSFLENKNGWHGKPLSEERLKLALSEIPEVKIKKIKIKSPKKLKLKNNKKTKQKITFYDEGNLVSTREAYGKALSELTSNPSIISVDGEVSNSTKSEFVKNTNPNQFIEAFIAEQNMVNMAQGLAAKGFNVFASTFSAFLSRAYDQIRMAAISSSDIHIVGSHAGVSIGEDGASQMGLEDISFFRTLPNSTIFYPSDANSTKYLTNLSSKLNNLTYLRTTRQETPVIYSKNEDFPVGDFKIVKKSSSDKFVLIGSGITLHESLKAQDELKKQKINVAVIDLYCIKPINIKKLFNFVKKHGNKIVITEDHHKEGGIGEAIISGLESLEPKNKIQVKHLFVEGVPHSGSKDELLNKYKIDSSNIIKTVNNFN